MKVVAPIVALIIAQAGSSYEDRRIQGWNVHIRTDLLAADKKGTEKAMSMMTEQMKRITKIVPSDSLNFLRTVPIFISPEYKGIQPRCEYHPGAQWLRDNGRDPNMAKGVEVTNTRIFEPETKRMPLFILHELAHAFHDQLMGFGDKRVIAAFEKASKSGKYDSVRRWDGKMVKHYAMSNPFEYFAEGSEAYFGANDFYPTNREELKSFDPDLYAILDDVWNHPPVKR